MLTPDEARRWAFVVLETNDAPPFALQDVADTLLAFVAQAEVDRRRIIALEVALGRFVPGLSIFPGEDEVK